MLSRHRLGHALDDSWGKGKVVWCTGSLTKDTAGGITVKCDQAESGASDSPHW